MRTATFLIISALFSLVVATTAMAEEKKEVGGTVKHTIMVPIIKKNTQDVVKIMPIIIEVHAETDEAKNYLVDRMPILQDAYMQATYGKLYTDIGYDAIAKILEAAVDSVATAELKGQYRATIRVNVRPQ